MAARRASPPTELNTSTQGNRPKLNPVSRKISHLSQTAPQSNAPPAEQTLLPSHTLLPSNRLLAVASTQEVEIKVEPDGDRNRVPTYFDHSSYLGTPHSHKVNPYSLDPYYRQFKNLQVEQPNPFFFDDPNPTPLPENVPSAKNTTSQGHEHLPDTALTSYRNLTLPSAELDQDMTSNLSAPDHPSTFNHRPHSSPPSANFAASAQWPLDRSSTYPSRPLVTSYAYDRSHVALPIQSFSPRSHHSSQGGHDTKGQQLADVSQVAIQSTSDTVVARQPTPGSTDNEVINLLVDAVSELASNGKKMAKEVAAIKKDVSGLDGKLDSIIESISAIVEKNSSTLEGKTAEFSSLPDNHESQKPTSVNQTLESLQDEFVQFKEVSSKGIDEFKKHIQQDIDDLKNAVNEDADQGRKIVKQDIGALEESIKREVYQYSDAIKQELFELKDAFNTVADEIKQDANPKATVPGDSINDEGSQVKSNTKKTFSQLREAIDSVKEEVTQLKQAVKGPNTVKSVDERLDILERAMFVPMESAPMAEVLYRLTATDSLLMNINRDTQLALTGQKKLFDVMGTFGDSLRYAGYDLAKDNVDAIAKAIKDQLEAARDELVRGAKDHMTDSAKLNNEMIQQAVRGLEMLHDKRTEKMGQILDGLETSVKKLVPTRSQELADLYIATAKIEETAGRCERVIAVAAGKAEGLMSYESDLAFLRFNDTTTARSLDSGMMELKGIMEECICCARTALENRTVIEVEVQRLVEHATGHAITQIVSRMQQRDAAMEEELNQKIPVIIHEAVDAAKQELAHAAKINAVVMEEPERTLHFPIQTAVPASDASQLKGPESGTLITAQPSRQTQENAAGVTAEQVQAIVNETVKLSVGETLGSIRTILRQERAVEAPGKDADHSVERDPAQIALRFTLRWNGDLCEGQSFSTSARSCQTIGKLREQLYKKLVECMRGHDVNISTVLMRSVTLEETSAPGVDSLRVTMSDGDLYLAWYARNVRGGWKSVLSVEVDFVNAA